MFRSSGHHSAPDLGSLGNHNRNFTSATSHQLTQTSSLSTAGALPTLSFECPRFPPHLLVAISGAGLLTFAHVFWTAVTLPATRTNSTLHPVTSCSHLKTKTEYHPDLACPQDLILKSLSQIRSVCEVDQSPQSQRKPTLSLGDKCLLPNGYSLPLGRCQFLSLGGTNWRQLSTKLSSSPLTCVMMQMQLWLWPKLHRHIFPPARMSLSWLWLPLSASPVPSRPSIDSCCCNARTIQLYIALPFTIVRNLYRFPIRGEQEGRLGRV